MRGTHVSLSSGDHFYVDASADDVRALVGPEAYARSMVLIGERWVAAAQVTQLVPADIPSIEIPERLEVPDGVGVE